MAYRALYREWRPKDFSHVVGQTAIIGTLRNQVITGRIAHAYLFCGSRGTGKTSTAKILAKAINCLQPENGDPCGQCENCLRADNEETLDVIEIDAASNNGVDEMRELRDTVKYPPQYGKYKVYIIDEVHMLSTSAFNALLKTLEEPPAHIVFILATTEPQKLPETILSRCQRFDFGRIPSTEIAGRLKEAAEGSGAQATDGALMMIARAADGGMRDALGILDMCLGYSDQVDETLVRNILGTSDTTFLFEFSEALAERDAAKVFAMIDRLMREGKDPAVFARDVCRHVRALLIAKTSPEDVSKIMDISGDEAAEYVRHCETVTVSRLMKILDIYMALETEMRYSSTPRMALENASIKSCLRIDDTDTQALNDRIDELEKKVSQLINNPGAVSQAVPKPAAEKKTEPSTGKETKKANFVPPASVNQDSAAVWKELMSRIRGKDMTAWSFLSQGHMIGCSNGRYLWQADRKEAENQFITVLNMPERNRTICDCLKEITGQDSAFTAVSQNKAAAAADNGGDDEYLEAIYETFGKEPVNIVDDI
ncbi:MAG: DNA polymerase III subunit gamma/tau [Clostridia bacterium]|nr:DNA polymerase III subunit gamma/tau [Clostridia bacterium]